MTSYAPSSSTSTGSKFNPSAYLRGLGWEGPGKALNDAPGARARPVTVAKKNGLTGVGKDRDTAFPWWEMVFATVATKVSGDKVRSRSEGQGECITWLFGRKSRFVVTSKHEC